jgi:parallel beta-helix repeat protein
MKDSSLQRASFGLPVIFALLLCAGGTISAQTKPTVITSVPYTITAPGKYVLQGNLAMPHNPTTPAITVNIPGTSFFRVLISLNGYTLSGNGSPYPGIDASKATSVSVVNGTIIGFNTAIILGDNSIARGLILATNVENIQVLATNVENIQVAGSGCLINNCVIGGPGIGIDVSGVGNVKISGNSLVGCKIGIICHTTSGCAVVGNYLASCVDSLSLDSHSISESNLITPADGTPGNSATGESPGY